MSDEPAPPPSSNEPSVSSFLVLFLSLTGIFIAMLVLAIYSYEINIVRIDSHSRLQSNDSPPIDPRQLVLTRSYLSQGCEVGHFQGCDAHDSIAVTSLRSSASLSDGAKALVSQYKYSSAYNLLKDLSIQGSDQDIVVLANNEEFKLVPLARFATLWYLDPAIAYSTTGREQDAISTFNIFLSMMRNRVLDDEWLSREGLDATDLPVLVDLFCRSDDSLSTNYCLLGLLQSLASPANPAGSPDVINGVKDFPSRYESVSAPFKREVISNYLALWQWDVSTAPPLLQNATPAQLSAYHYVLGVKLYNAAMQLKGNRCLALLERSKQEFRAAQTPDKSKSYFSDPAKRQLQDISSRKESPCS